MIRAKSRSRTSITYRLWRGYPQRFSCLAFKLTPSVGPSAASPRLCFVIGELPKIQRKTHNLALVENAHLFQ